MQLPLGTPVPGFNLPDVVSARVISPSSFEDRAALLVMFLCRHCPFVKHVQRQLAQLGKDYCSKDVGIIAIGSNDASAYPEDAPDSLKEMANELGFTFPYCYDESQEVAKAFAAACTPDFFVFNREQRLMYRGQLDDSRPGNGKPATGADLRAAIDAVLAGQPVSADQRPSIGCNIKWKRSRK